VVLGTDDPLLVAQVGHLDLLASGEPVVGRDDEHGGVGEQRGQ